MANVFYLDVDDEITSAAARIRSSQDPRVGLVVPPGSRIATSRINFRLLAREALERNRGLSIVSSDPAARALAASAGLPVFATVAEFEADQGTVRPTIAPAAGPSTQTSSQAKGNIKDSARPGKASKGGGSTNAGQMAAFGDAAVAAAPAPGGLRSAADARIGARSSGAAAPAVRAASRTSRASTRVAAGIVTVLIMVLVLGLIGVFLLPSATITVSPKLEAVGPIQLSIRADPNATSSDPVAGVVPALVLTMDFTASGTFNATGTKVNTTPASGTVTFSNNDTGNGVTIPSGSKVGTENGTMFATTQDVTVPRARFKPSFRPGTASVGVTAATAGTAGNVPAGAIDQVPSGYSGVLLNVTNPVATTGGTKTTTTQIQKKDTDAAVAGLTKNLKAQYTSWLAAPGGLAPGSTAFPKTGVLGVITPDNDPASLIGVTQATFDLTLTASGSETAVDQSTVSGLAASRVDTTVPTDFTLVAGSEKVTIGTPRTDGTAIVFPVTATASQVRQLDPDTLRQQVLGKSVDEARAILAQDGTVDIQTWPGFVGTIPSLAWRLTLTVDTSGITASPGPGASPNGASDLPSPVPSSGPSSGPSAAPSTGPSGVVPGNGRVNG
ncbi:MAG TPA: baseplate J/gp47 family protein [Candidatus Limnocylindrales bacterium]